MSGINKKPLETKLSPEESDDLFNALCGDSNDKTGEPSYAAQMVAGKVAYDQIYAPRNVYNGRGPYAIGIEENPALKR